MKHRSSIKSIAAAVLILLLSWGYLFTPQAFFSLNDRLRDYLFLTRGELPQSDRVVIIDIDESALRQYGQWPWPRIIFADLLTKLTEAGAGIIGLDVVFAEADQSSPHRIAAKIEGNTAVLDDYDAILASVFATTPTVGGYVFTFGDREHRGEEPPLVPAVFIEKGFGANTNIIKPDGVILNLERLQEQLYSSGFFNNLPDEGGMIRRVPLVMRYEDMLYPSLVLEMIRIFQDVSRVYIDGDEAGVAQVRLGEIKIPTDASGRLIVNFRGPGRHFRYISAADVLNDQVKPDEIADKFVLVGTSAVGLYDLRSIPYDSNIAGVEVHANVLDNILSGDFLYGPSEVRLYDLVIISAIVVSIFVLLAYIDSWLMLPVLIGSAYLLFRLSLYAVFSEGIVLNLLFPSLAFVLSIVLSLSIDYIIAARQREAIKRIFAKKVSKAVMDDLLKNGDDDILKVRDEEVTIFFSDIRGFTGISETIGSSQRLVELLNRYMTPIVEEIAESEGTVDKFIGDAIMAYWNAPITMPDYADKAVASALNQLDLLQKMNLELKKEFGVRLEIGIGIHTGLVTVGEMGSTGRSDYTIIGDSVNLASRLEGLNKLYGTSIIISEATKMALKKAYVLRSLDLVRVKGRHEPVEVFEVIAAGEALQYRDELAAYAVALDLYRKEVIAEARQHFMILQERHKRPLYALYLERCQYYFDHPEVMFEVVHTMEGK